MKLRDTAERLFWTVVAAVTAGLVAGPVVDVSVWQGAVMTALTAAANFVSILARSRLAALPEPGEGLPGLPVEPDH